MNKLVSIFLVFSAIACIHQKPHYDVVRKQPKTNFPNLGIVWLRDSLYIDEHEVRNIDYIEFLYWTGRMQPERYVSLLPDTIDRTKKLHWSEPYVEYYLRHPAYRNCPVVGVSYEQAVAFCEWRTNMVNRFLYIRDNPKVVKEVHWDSVKVFPKRLHFRLPTKEEWEYASAAGLSYEKYPQGYENLSDEYGFPVSKTAADSMLWMNPNFLKRRGIPFINRHNVYNGVTEEDKQPVKSGKPNSYGIYNLPGNVSELIADSLFKGMNYQTDLDGKLFRVNSRNYQVADSTKNPYDYKYTFHYREPQPWLGFRCVCEELTR
jgi:formylglycine-generating enzyme